MFKQELVAATLACVFALPATGLAAGDEEIRQIREQINQLKESYEARIKELEKRLDEAEAQAAKAQSAAGAAAESATKAQSAAIQATSRPASEGAFNPAVSVILNGVYTNLSQDPAKFQITGFVPTQGEVSPGKRGFSLGESELAIASNIDPYLRGTLIASVTPDDSISIEEGYLQTIALANGFTVKAGRFFSPVGYLNEVHAHAWDFTDAPLANKVFLGNQLSDDGIQVKWIAPTELFFEIGGELSRGRAFPGSGRDKNGGGASNLFAHLGGDIGDSYAWRTGVSWLGTSPQDRVYTDLNAAGATVTNSFTGDSRLWGADFLLKWAPHGNPVNTNFKLQGEYFRRKENGTLSFDTAGASSGPKLGGYASDQSGWYLQAVYQFLPRWRAGYRYDRLNFGTVDIGLVDSGALSAANFPTLADYSPTRNTLMFDYNPSEFTRVRLQFAQDKSHMGVTDNEVFLQYILSLGAHGAHKF